MKDYLKIAGKTAIVTGSGRGIGRGVAAGLASYGAKVMVADINDENGVKVRDEIIAEGGVADYCHCDVCKIGDIRNLVAKTAEKFGTIDILVNNAGGGEPPCDFFTITDERWDHYIRFNLYSAFYMIREVFPYMKKQKKTAGAVFITRSGRPLDRSNIWRDMKALCERAGVEPGKVFPHNLRHLFARTYYMLEKDLSRLADILGHTNVSTTRIYTAESGTVHARQMERMGLVIT